MKLPEISIKNPVFTWMLMISLLLFGAISFQRMGVSQLPDVDFPYVNVSISFDGAAPEVMESTIVDPIEGALTAVEGVKSMSSTSRAGSARISLEFDLDKNIDVAVQEVQTVLSQVQRRLPDGVEAPIVSKSNPEDQPILWLSVRSEKMSKREFMTYVRDRVKDQFTTIPGVGEIILGGYLDPSLNVWVSNQKLRQYQLTVDDVLDSIRREHEEPPAGRIETKEKEYNVRAMGEAQTAEEFSTLEIKRRGGSPNYQPLRLLDVSRVEDGVSEIRRISRTKGQPSVGIGIRKQRGSNAVDVAKQVKEKLVEVEKGLPEGMSIGVNYDQTKFIEEAVHELNFHLVLAAILTSLVCWFFLGSFSATINVILAIPTSVVGTFIVLYAMGFTLNTFTLLALTLSVGIVVDDAIMVLENIVRYREMKKSKKEAALKGAVEITFAAFAATAAIVAIFLPVAFMEGLIGKYFYQFGVTLSVAVCFSLLEALTLTPMRCASFLKVEERRTRIGKFAEALFTKLENTYSKVLPWVIDHKGKTLVGSILIFFVSLLPLKFLKKEMTPAQDQGNFMIRMTTPEGSSLAHTDSKVKFVEEILESTSEIQNYFVSVGGFGGGEVNSATSFITLKDKRDRKKSQMQVMNELREKFKSLQGIKAFVFDPSQGGFGSRRSYPFEVSLRGPDWKSLGETSEKLAKRLEEEGILQDAETEYKANMPEVHLVPNREAALRRGVSISDIGNTISYLLGGVTAAKFTQDGKRYDIRLRLDPSERENVKSLEKFQVRNNRGELIPLSELVKIEEVNTLLSMVRLDRERAVGVFGNISDNSSQSEALKRAEEISAEILPEGYRLVIGGSSQIFQDSFKSLAFALILGIVVAYMILASQFNSFIDPVTVLLALPFSASGAFLFLWMTGKSLNMFSMIGLLLLMGIVKKNSILLVDFANEAKKKGASVRDAILQAGPVRLRPILMTSLATIAGALPQALAFGPGSETRSPMALAVVGGVLVSTLLTLVVVPSFYALVSRDLHKEPSSNLPE